MKREDITNGRELAEELGSWLKEDSVTPDGEVMKQAEELKTCFEDLMKAYNDDGENDIVNILAEDDYLLEELSDKLGLVSLMEISNEELTAEEREIPYLTLIDTCFESAKIRNPLGGFGKDRLEAGLGVLRSFENKYWPLVSCITPGNAIAFRGFIPDEHYDDILAGRKKALGAIRHSGNKKSVAGVAVYSYSPGAEGDNGIIRLEWIYVADEYKQAGVGNMLMAEIAGYAVKVPGTMITTDINIPELKDDEERQEFELLENFLDSWKFGFTIRLGWNFHIAVGDLKDNKYMNGPAEGVTSLAALGNRGPLMIKRFFKSMNRSYDTGIMETDYAFFDTKSSCAIVEDNSIMALLLFHKLSNGDYRYEALRSRPGYDPMSLLKLIRFAYQAVKDEAEDTFVFGRFESEEGFLTMQRIFPDAHTLMQYHGILNTLPNEEIITGDQWSMLRKEAGFKDDKIPAGSLTAEDFSEERLKKLSDLLKLQ